jgi:hypothetical protein
MENGQRYHFAPKFLFVADPALAGGPARISLRYGAPEIAVWPCGPSRSLRRVRWEGCVDRRGLVSVLRAWVATCARSSYECTP